MPCSFAILFNFLSFILSAMKADTISRMKKDKVMTASAIVITPGLQTERQM